MMNGHKGPISKSLKIRQNISLKFLKNIITPTQLFWTSRAPFSNTHTQTQCEEGARDVNIVRDTKVTNLCASIIHPPFQQD